MEDFKKGGHFDHLYADGERMGFAKGGAVNKSDHATIQRSEPTNELDKESGGKSALRPGFAKGGKAKRPKKGKKLKKTGSESLISRLKNKSQRHLDEMDMAEGGEVDKKAARKAKLKKRYKKEKAAAKHLEKVRKNAKKVTGAQMTEKEYETIKKRTSRTKKRVGGPVMAKKGGVPTHSSKPMYGK